MSFGSPPKLDYAKRSPPPSPTSRSRTSTASSVLSFDDGMAGRLAPTRGKNRIFKVFRFLAPLEADGQTGLADAMRTFVAQNKRRGVAILISDLYDPEGFKEGINRFATRSSSPTCCRSSTRWRCARRCTATCVSSTTRPAKPAR